MKKNTLCEIAVKRELLSALQIHVFVHSESRKKRSLLSTMPAIVCDKFRSRS